ncbi:unnamed protein product [Schistocephalus solidus]|uniref:Uncharacterized protein n=1 Tax=Schistocephalus solidus TaxID=70667 RepID=A0A183T878_SCHSO|nr:unnamed protein product [Schistocephalus solidus]
MVELTCMGDQVLCGTCPPTVRLDIVLRSELGWWWRRKCGGCCVSRRCSTPSVGRAVEIVAHDSRIVGLSTGSSEVKQRCLLFSCSQGTPVSLESGQFACLCERLHEHCRGNLSFNLSLGLDIKDSSTAASATIIAVNSLPRVNHAKVGVHTDIAPPTFLSCHIYTLCLRHCVVLLVNVWRDLEGPQLSASCLTITGASIISSTVLPAAMHIPNERRDYFLLFAIKRSVGAPC